MPSIPLQELFEEFNARIDKPIEYNHLLTSLIAELYGATSPISWVDGVPYLFDPTRGFGVSVPRTTVSAGWYGTGVTNRYLKIGDVTGAGGTGFVIPRDAVITGLWAKSRNNSNWQVEIRRNNVPITLAGTSVVSGIGYDGNINILLNQGDWIQFFAAGATIDHPIATVELAWRTTI